VESTITDEELTELVQRTEPMIERQHSQVGGLPDQDCSLRVTHVYRRSSQAVRIRV
jgi:hypothetical protein